MSAVVAVVTAAGVIYAGLFFNPFPTDCWTYYELSNTVFTDFFRVTTLRQFEHTNSYSSSFPPLWPVVIAVVRVAGLDLGIYSGTALCALICVGLLGTLNQLSLRIGLPSWVGSLCFLVLLAYPPFAAEVQSGGSLVLSVWLTALLVSSLLIPTVPGLARAARLGGLAGLNCLTRFDFALAATLIGVILLAYEARSWSARLARGVCYFAVFAICLAPWTAYNVRHFGKPFASDNTRQVLLARADHVTSYYEDGPNLPTVKSDPVAWAKGLICSKLPHTLVGIVGSFGASLLPVLAVVLAAVGGSETHTPSPKTMAAGVRRLTRLTVVVLAALYVPLVLTGYADNRYFSVWVLLIAMVMCGHIAAKVPLQRWSGPRVLATLSLAAGAALWPWQTLVTRQHVDVTAPAAYLVRTQPTPEMQRLADVIQKDAAGRPHRVVITSQPKSEAGSPAWAAHFGAVTGVPAALFPKLHGSFAAFVRDFEISHVYDPEDQLRGFDLIGVRLVELPLPGAYRIELTRPVPNQ